MNLETLAWLRSEQGRDVLAEAESADLGAPARLRTLERLRRLVTPEQAAAAYEIALLRRRAADKFSHAAQMFFTRDGLEQSSGERIARQRAGRYAALLGGAGQVADLCCGIGGDTLALAQANRVTAVDIDPVRLAIARANAEALGVAGRITFLERDLEHGSPPPCDAIFFDPSRRQGGRRVFRLAEYRPPVALVQQWRRSTPAIGIKIAPGVAYEELDALGATETEFISVDGELKEALAWMGPLGVAGRRATLLREGSETVSLWFASGDRMPDVPVEAPGRYLIEPDPAVLRAGLVRVLAHALGAAQLDATIAYLTISTPVVSPFVRVWQVLEWLPFSLKRVQARVRALDAGAVTVKKRGSALDTDVLARKLSGSGTRPLVVVLTLVAGKPAALICEGPLSQATTKQ